MAEDGQTTLEAGPYRGSTSELNFIVDAPASKDELDAHAPIAAAITSVIRNADRIKMIGLIGGWGSGKSTVAQLAKIELEKKPAKGKPVLRCFTFDAWQHQSDPPRRAFLEALAQYLETDRAFEDLRHGEDDPLPEWKTKLEDLRVLTEKTTTTTTPTLTTAGRVLVVSAVGVPIGLRLLGDGTLSIEAQRDTAASVIFVLAWLLATGPLLVMVLLYILWRPWKSANQIRSLKALWAFLRHHKKSRARESILSVIANKAEETKTDVRKKTPDPTAIEFQESFRDMIAAAHTSNRRLVLIVDNLDRLPADEAKTIWATVRSLFLGTDAKRVIKREDLPTVIMPIDASSIEKMYGDNEQGLSRSFLEKTFDLVFHVPTPVLSRWHRYMQDKLKAVFRAEISENDISNIRSIYERKLGSDKATPRSINNFVNAIAVIWLERQGKDIDIAIVAYYVTERDDFVKDFDKALETDVDLLETLDEDWRTAVAALHSGLSRVDADELFMDGPIRSAIQAGDLPHFKILADRPGFDRYFIRVLSKPSEGHGTLRVLTAAALLGAQERKPWMREAWTLLRRASLTIDANTEVGELDPEGIGPLVESTNAGPERARYLDAMSAALGRLDSAAWKDGGKLYGRLARGLIDQAHDAGVQNFEIVVPGGGGRYYQMLQQGFPDRVMRSMIPTSGDIEELIPILVDRLNESEFHKGVARASAALWDRSPEGIDWTPMVGAVRAALAWGENTREVSGAETLIALYPRVEAMRDSVATWIDEGVFGPVWTTAWEQKEDNVLTRLAALMIAADGPLEPANSHSWEERLEASPELPAAVAAALEEISMSRDLVWLMSRSKKSPSAKPLLRGLASRLVESPSFDGVDTEVVLDEVTAFNDLVPPESRAAFWQTMSAREDFWRALDGLTVRNRAEVLHILALNLANRSRLGRALKSHLESYGKNDWEEALRDGSNAYPFLTDLDAIHSTVRLGTPVYTALRDTISALLSTDDEAYRDRWFRLAKRLKAELHRSVLNMLADAINSGASVEQLHRVLVAGGPELIEKFEYHPDRAVLRIVSVLIESSDGLRWLTENSRTAQGWVEKSSKDTRFTLAEQFKAMQNDTTASALYLTLGLRKEFG